MKVAIVNYGMGNLASVRKAFESIGTDVYIANNPAELHIADKIILPGVGAFAEGMKCLVNDGWASALHELVTLQGRPLLGICLGMQMLATYGSEGGLTQGLNLIPGQVMHLDTLGCTLRIPHVGWNEVQYKVKDMLFENIPDSSDFYFVHSYAFVPEIDKHIIATVPYGVDIAAVIRNEHVYGCQFHPEKSSKAGLHFLKSFIGHLQC